MGKSVGEILKSTRLGRQITLEQASFATRIRQRYLEALEKDLLELIPSETQARGFLRIYAEFLEIPYQPLLEEWNRINRQNGNTTISNPILPNDFHTGKQQGVSAKLIETPEQNKDSDKCSSKQIFEEIGTDIYKQRTILGLSLQDIEEHTHVKQHYLSIIEAGKFEKLPSLVQARGLLLNYVSFLQMDVDRILTRFADALQSRRIEMVAPTQRRNKVILKDVSNIRWKKLLNPDMMVGSILVLILFIFAVWGVAKVSRIKELPISNDSISTNLDLGTITPILLPIDTNLTEINTQIATQMNSIQGETNGQGQVEKSENNDPIQLYIVANQRAFLKITADDKIVFNGRTVPGSAYSFSATDKIELLTGNSAALQVIYNQKDIGTIGLIGQPNRIIFSVAGYTTPTPQFTATATNTPQPTLTMAATPTQGTYTITPYIP